MSGARYVRCLWAPLRGANMLLPNAAVAEVGNYRVPDAQSGKPDWLLGTINWRGQPIPVISIEALCGDEVPANLLYSRLLIVNSVMPENPVRHYAVVTAGLPRPLRFDNNMPEHAEACDLPGLCMRVYIGDEQAVIPDLDYIENLLKQHWHAAA